MINILKTDFYKASRTTSFWVTLFFSILSILISTIVTFWIYTGSIFSEYLAEAESSSVNFFNFFPTILSDCTFLIGIFAIMFSIADFNNGTIKNIASKGYHREYIYLSKFVTVLGAALIHLIASFVTAFITAQIMINNKIPNFFSYNEDFLPKMAKFSLQLVAYISIAILLTMLIRSLGSSLAIFLAFFFLESSIADLINNLISTVFNSDFSISPYLIHNAFAGSDSTTQGVIVVLAYIVVSAAIGIYTFRKRDIN